MVSSRSHALLLDLKHFATATIMERCFSSPERNAERWQPIGCLVAHLPIFITIHSQFCLWVLLFLPVGTPAILGEAPSYFRSLSPAIMFLFHRHRHVENMCSCQRMRLFSSLSGKQSVTCSMRYRRVHIPYKHQNLRCMSMLSILTPG